MNRTEGVPQYPLFPSLAAPKAVEAVCLLASLSPASSSNFPEHNELRFASADRQAAWDWIEPLAQIPHACVHELFEKQAACNPGAVAVICNGRQLTYGELNSRANQVANYLRKRGVGPETLVGVCLERSPELVIALFGVWKAGGAYIPFDPSYPQPRLSLMANDAGMKFLLTEAKCAKLFPSLFDSAIRMDSDWPAVSGEGTENLGSIASPQNLAYVMFTSGSTGQPKGAMIQHRGLVSYLAWAIKTYQVEGQGAVPVHSSIAFDSTVASLYPPLLSGGQIELLGEDVGAQNLLVALRRTKNRNKLLLTPAHLELLNQQLAPEEMADITKVLVIAGEALHAEKLSKWRDFAPATRLFNEYGPTETTVGCCAYEVRSTDPRSGPVPIGTPIANAEIYVLDSDLRPVPQGVIGELHIGGAGVGRGYFEKPELTRERFLSNPFSDHGSEKMYKTGDLGRVRTDGTLEFLGRADDQVKLRGYRIELGEIETTIARHPGIQSCKVLVREDTPGNSQLVAYVIALEPRSADAESLRKFLKQSLPDYMVPSYFVFLNSFPLTPHGKVDRKALPMPSRRDTQADKTFVTPRSEIEKKLAAILAGLLKTERVGIFDDFFDAGGNSLLAIRLSLQIQELFGVSLSMHAFFPSTTVAGLAEVIQNRECSATGLAYAVAVQPKGTEVPIFWMGPPARGVSLSEQLGNDQPFFDVGFEPRTVSQLKAPYRMEEIAAHLVLALREKQPKGPYRLGGFCLGAVLAYEVARQLSAAGLEVAQLILLEPLNPMQPAKARMVIGLKRMIVRVKFRERQLRHLGIRELPGYVGGRLNGVKCLLKDLAWRIAARSRFQKRELRSPELGKILYYAASSYLPQPLRCTTIIFRCRDWPMLSAGDPFFGWTELLLGPAESHEIPGDHAGIFHGPSARLMVEELQSSFRNAKPAVTSV
jgi:amino acid adenylation domain-containing protein